jgi:hypothetical protein
MIHNVFTDLVGIADFEDFTIDVGSSVEQRGKNTKNNLL